MILKGKQQKYQHYHQVRLKDMNILQVKKYDQSRIKEQAKFTYSPLGKVFEIKKIENQGIKQVEALKALKPEENKQDIKSIKNEIHEIKNWEEKIKKKKIYNMKQKKRVYDFQQYETIRSFGKTIYTQKVQKAEAKEYQSNLLKNILEFNNKSIRIKKRYL